MGQKSVVVQFGASFAIAVDYFPKYLFEEIIMTALKQQDDSLSPEASNPIQSNNDLQSEPQRLKMLFDFTDADLMLNRKGELSERQLVQHGQRLFNQLLDKWTRLITMAVFLICFILFVIFAQTFGSQLGPLMLIAIVGWLAAIYILVSLVRIIANRIRAQRSANIPMNANLDSHILKQLSGLLKIVSDGEHTYVMVDDRELTNSAEADAQASLWKLEPEKRYTLYYIEQPFWVVAVEPIAS